MHLSGGSAYHSVHMRSILAVLPTPFSHNLVTPGSRPASSSKHFPDLLLRGGCGSRCPAQGILPRCCSTAAQQLLPAGVQPGQLDPAEHVSGISLVYLAGHANCVSLSTDAQLAQDSTLITHLDWQGAECQQTRDCRSAEWRHARGPQRLWDPSAPIICTR